MKLSYLLSSLKMLAHGKIGYSCTPSLSQQHLYLCLHLISSSLTSLMNKSFSCNLLFTSYVVNWHCSSLLSRKWISFKMMFLTIPISLKWHLAQSLIFCFQDLSLIDNQLKPSLTFHQSVLPLRVLMNPARSLIEPHQFKAEGGRTPPFALSVKHDRAMIRNRFCKGGLAYLQNKSSHSPHTKNLSRRDIIGGLYWLDHIYRAPPNCKSITVPVYPIRELHHICRVVDATRPFQRKSNYIPIPPMRQAPFHLKVITQPQNNGVDNYRLDHKQK